MASDPLLGADAENLGKWDIEEIDKPPRIFVLAEDAPYLRSLYLDVLWGWERIAEEAPSPSPSLEIEGGEEESEMHDRRVDRLPLSPRSSGRGGRG